MSICTLATLMRIKHALPLECNCVTPFNPALISRYTIDWSVLTQSIWAADLMRPTARQYDQQPAAVHWWPLTVHRISGVSASSHRQCDPPLLNSLMSPSRTEGSLPTHLHTQCLWMAEPNRAHASQTNCYTMTPPRPGHAWRHRDPPEPGSPALGTSRAPLLRLSVPHPGKHVVMVCIKLAS
jgi:hypothetical protein